MVTSTLGLRVFSRITNHLIAMVDFVLQNNLIVGNTSFQKPKEKLWTWRSRKGDLAQIVFCLYRKRWRNSIKDCQAFNSSNSVGCDHRIVSAKICLSVRTPKVISQTKLYWRAIRDDQVLANTFENLPDPQKTYAEFVRICIQVGNEILPPKPPRDPDTVYSKQVSSARRATLRSSTKNL